MNRAERRASERRRPKLEFLPVLEYDAKARLSEAFCVHPAHGPLRRVSTWKRDPATMTGVHHLDYAVVDDPESQMPGWCDPCQWFVWYDPGSDTFGVAMPGYGAAVLPGDWFADPDLAQVQIARVQVEIEAMRGASRPAVYGPAADG